MRKPRYFWLAFAACLGLVVVWLFRPHPPAHRINQESYDKIQIGMSPEEVEAIFGVPPGSYSTKKGSVCLTCTPGFLAGQTTELDWISDEAVIQVWLNDEKKVIYCEGTLFADETVFDQLRRWLGFEPKNRTLTCVGTGTGTAE